jgi:hypothetical protein
MDGLRGRQPPDINLFKSMTSPCFAPGSEIYGAWALTPVF